MRKPAPNGAAPPAEQAQTSVANELPPPPPPGGVPEVRRVRGPAAALASALRAGTTATATATDEDVAAVVTANAAVRTALGPAVAAGAVHVALAVRAVARWEPAVAARAAVEHVRDIRAAAATTRPRSTVGRSGRRR